MCTALTIKSEDGYSFFGRNMDLEYEFGQSVMIIPKGYKCINFATKEDMPIKHAIIAMGGVIENHPALADGMNEVGLACAGLNFQGYAYFEKEVKSGMVNLAPYDLILWILSTFENIEEVREALSNVNLVDVPMNKNTPVPTLHWIVSDKSGESIIIEKTKEKLNIYNNKVGILTNNPEFPWHTTNLNNYINLSNTQKNEDKWSDLTLSPLGVGAGTHGIPGDYSTVSRFVKIAFLRDKMKIVKDESTAINEFFHMLSNVAMVSGGVVTESGHYDITLYTSCMNLQKGIYYYKNYYNNRINAINLNNEDLSGCEIIKYKYMNNEDILFQN